MNVDKPNDAYLDEDLGRLIHFGIDDPLGKQLASGEFTIPLTYGQAIEEVEDFPPAFIPLLWEGSALIGVWKHWFDAERKTTIVRMSREARSNIQEVARSLKQMIFLRIFDGALGFGDVPEDIVPVITALDLADPLEMKNVILEHYDDPKGLMTFDIVRSDPPLPIGSDYYSGDFFCFEQKERFDLNRYAGLEIRAGHLSSLGNLPPWFEEGPKWNLFLDYFKRKDWRKAWLTLHSHGWRFEQVINAMAMLKDAVPNPRFKGYAEAWLAIEHDEEHRY